MKFGTSGLRGLVVDMTDAACEAYMRAFLDHLSRSVGRPTEVLIGQDLRPSSPRIAAACLRSAVAAGLRAIDCGPTPTPALAMEAMARGAPAVMVTGSHIPFDRNGIKFYRADGELSKSDETGILEAMKDPSPDVPGGIAIIAEGVAKRYVDRVVDAFPVGFLLGRRIGIHQHSAVGRDLLVDALRRAGAEPIPLGRVDVFVPIDTEAVSAEHAAQAQAWTVEHRLDALVSTDGDGDRPLVADERGNFFRGDMIGILVARALGADAVATPISTNSALELSGWFPRVMRTRIGSPYVIDAMERLARAGARLPVAFEANGGFLLGADATGPSGATLSALPTRDALLPIFAMLAMTGEAPLSTLRTLPPARFTASDRLQDAPSHQVAPLLEALATDEAARKAFCAPLGRGAPIAVETLDGVRMTFANRDVLHLRGSGNAPELRCYSESDSIRSADDLVAAGVELAKARLDHR